MSRPETAPKTPGEGALNPREALFRAAATVAPVLRRGDGEPVFSAPWEAQTFAMTLALHERGLFTWEAWTQALGAAIRAAQVAGDPDDGSSAYRHWLSALERLVTELGVASATALTARRDAWDRAAHATPHGQPITLEADPLAEPRERAPS